MDLNAILNGPGTRATGQIPSPSCVLGLPNELYGPILSHLCNRDLKSLRLSCRFLHGIAHLRLGRVFLSANPRNIEVLRAIADSGAYRHGVTELIWDDARLKRQQSLYSDQRFEDPFSQDSEEDDEAPGCPSWFAEECRDNVDELHSRKGDDVERPEHIAGAQQVAAQLPLTECWTHYQELLRQQSGILEPSADEAAFRHALDRFPSLKRVTVAPATHGWLFSPLYETPMIRALPHGFNYPIPRGWPTAAAGDPPPNAAPWEENSEEYRSLWRGVRIALRVLSEESTPLAHHLHKATQLSMRENFHQGTYLIFFANMGSTPNTRHCEGPACA